MRENNANISKLVKIGKILSGEPTSLEMLPDQIGAMKYAPIVSCDVEWSFSTYKNVLSEKRTNFTLENLEMYMIYYAENDVNVE